MKLPAHLMVSEADGALYDTRQPHWYSKPALRAIYCRAQPAIAGGAKGCQQVKAALRNGPFAWPGGYPLFFVCDDGEALCFDCCRKELWQVLHAVSTRQRDGWRVQGCQVNYEDAELTCSHCNKLVGAAYA